MKKLTSILFIQKEENNLKVKIGNLKRLDN